MAPEQGLPILTETEKRPRINLVDSFLEPIVAMTEAQGELYIATAARVYRLVRDDGNEYLEPLKIAP